MNISKAYSDNCNNLMIDRYPDLYKHRCCDQEDFSIAVCIEGNDNENIGSEKPFLLNNCETKVCLFGFSKPNSGYKIISSSYEVCVVGDYDVKSYSYSTKNWNNFPELYYPNIYSICCFMQKLYIITGYLGNSGYSNFYKRENNK